MALYAARTRTHQYFYIIYKKKYIYIRRISAAYSRILESGRISWAQISTGPRDVRTVELHYTFWAHFILFVSFHPRDGRKTGCRRNDCGLETLSIALSRNRKTFVYSAPSTFFSCLQHLILCLIKIGTLIRRLHIYKSQYP